MDHLSTDDQQWKTKALKLAEKKSSFDVHDLNPKEDTTFVIELARSNSYPLTIHFDQKSLGRAEFRPVPNPEVIRMLAEEGEKVRKMNRSKNLNYD